MPFPKTLLAALAATALAAVASGCGSGSSSSASTGPAAAGPITGTLDEWSVAVSKPDAKAGKVTFAIANRGKITHEFVVLKTGRAAGALANGKPKIDESGNVGETGDIKAGASKTVTLNLKPGHYSLVCNLPAHYAQGMHTDFTVS
jgi:uncharacterized cupredoxin-like copper-binding protein